MQILARFDPMDPDENEVFCLDFVNDLGVGESLSSSVWQIEVLSGVDATPAARLNGVAQIQNLTQSIQRLSGLQPGVTYRVRSVATTTNGNTLTLWSYVSCNSWALN